MDLARAEKWRREFRLASESSRADPGFGGEIKQKTPGFRRWPRWAGDARAHGAGAENGGAAHEQRFGAVNAGSVEAAAVAVGWALMRKLSVFDFVWRCDPGGKAGPRFVAEQLRGAEFALGRVFAELGVEKSVVETGASRVGGAGAVVDGVERAPNRRPQDTWGRARNWCRARSRQA